MPTVTDRTCPSRPSTRSCHAPFVVKQTTSAGDPAGASVSPARRAALDHTDGSLSGGRESVAANAVANKNERCTVGVYARRLA